MIWTVIIIVLGVLCMVNFVKVAVYGRSFVHPNFERVDRIFREKTGFPAQGRTSWNNWFGKLIYYFLLLFFIGLIALAIYIIKSLAI